LLYFFYFFFSSCFLLPIQSTFLSHLFLAFPLQKLGYKADTKNEYSRCTGSLEVQMFVRVALVQPVVIGTSQSDQFGALGVADHPALRSGCNYLRRMGRSSDHHQRAPLTSLQHSTLEHLLTLRNLRASIS
jgi:hypothetical protein